jgi:hypothetical protein
VRCEERLRGCIALDLEFLTPCEGFRRIWKERAIPRRDHLPPFPKRESCFGEKALRRNCFDPVGEIRFCGDDRSLGFEPVGQFLERAGDGGALAGAG